MRSPWIGGDLITPADRVTSDLTLKLNDCGGLDSGGLKSPRRGEGGDSAANNQDVDPNVLTWGWKIRARASVSESSGELYGNRQPMRLIADPARNARRVIFIYC